jgi:hypothetical protein
MSLKKVEPETGRAIVRAWLAVESPDPDELEAINHLKALDAR